MGRLQPVIYEDYATVRHDHDYCLIVIGVLKSIVQALPISQSCVANAKSTLQVLVEVTKAHGGELRIDSPLQ